MDTMYIQVLYGLRARSAPFHGVQDVVLQVVLRHSQRCSPWSTQEQAQRTLGMPFVLPR